MQKKINSSEENSSLSTRNPDKLSDRELLANALESATEARDERSMPARWSMNKVCVFGEAFLCLAVL